MSLGINWTSLLLAYPPEVLFAMKACLGILERGSRSASFSSGLLSLVKPPGTMVPQQHLVSSMSCLPSPHSHPAVWGSAMVPTAQDLCGKLPTFRPRILPWQPPTPNQVTMVLERGLNLGWSWTCLRDLGSYLIWWRFVFFQMLSVMQSDGGIPLSSPQWPPPAKYLPL